MHHSHAAKWHRVLTHHIFKRMATGIVTASAGYNATREEMMHCWRLAEEELAEDQLAAEEDILTCAGPLSPVGELQHQQEAAAALAVVEEVGWQW